MEANKIMGADILDILFDGRNKAYGAYELRKSYNKRMVRALIIMLGVCLLIFIGSVIAKKIDEGKPKQMEVKDVVLEDIKEPEKKNEPPPPPPPPKEPPKVQVTKFTPPKIVKDEEVKPEEKPPEQEKLEDTKIGSFNQEGVKSDVVEAPVEKGTGKVEAPKVATEDYDKEFTSVQVEAKFPGDWSKYLTHNLNSQVPADNGAPAGRYTVTVSFLVAKDGSISEVQALNDPGYGCGAEAVRVIKKGPKWQPAIQNGRNVIYRQKQNIVFVVSDQ
ncbi:energy transducer TonB [Parafilimonas sp.]|uniref:energy transducer TonB n=1 Tax=Parafilimonas sp. TaxID=1969739 RepID=UPI0039E34921